MDGKDWQPIETAPKDGTHILIARWHSGSRSWSYDVGYWHVATSEHGITGWYCNGGLGGGLWWRHLPPDPPAPGASP